MLKSLNYKTQVLLLLYFVLFGISINAQNQDSNAYIRFIDSADNHIDEDSKKALLFLDSIPDPIENHISGRLAEYYALKVLVHDDFKEYSKMNHCNILALRYAEKEKNYKIAGQACLDLFSDDYFVNRDTTAYKYLDKAARYYEMCNYTNGLLEIKQMRAYAKFLDGEYEDCNAMLLKHLEEYKSIKEDAYFYLFATYMLTSNYIYIDRLNEAHKNFKAFKTLKNDTTITAYNYASFEAAINTCFADVYFTKKRTDSVFYYLKKASKQREYMGEDAIVDYYELYANAYKDTGKLDNSKAYLDSLMAFERKIYKNNLDASYQINDSLLQAERDLQEINESQFFNMLIILALFGVLILISTLYVLFYRKNKWALNNLSNQAENFSYLKSNNEKLAVKVHGLEDYISQLKKEVKSIATIDDAPNQRESIKAFYKNLHYNSSTLLDKAENHFEIVNDLNISFFKKIQDTYPQLNNSEIIICYYIFIGFKNKEISVFLNTTIRAIESKRYRITKKINLDTITLLQHLKKTF